MPRPRRSTRYFTVAFRAAPDEGEGVLVGYASLYDNTYSIGGGMQECITRGAFDDSCGRDGAVLPLFYEHNWDEPIGVVLATSDAKGVRVRAELFVNDNEKARSIYLAAKAGALREWSIGFAAAADDVRLAGKVEHIDRGDLIEASVVVRGANLTEMLAVRAAADDAGEPADEAADDTGDEAAEEVSVEQVRKLVAALIYGEANELLQGGQAAGSIRALLGVLSQLDWFEEIDAAEDAATPVDYEMAMSRSWFRDVMRSVMVQSDSSPEAQE